MIGTLNEGSLHAQLKAWYARPGDALEQPVEGYVIDLVRDGMLVEVQTGGLAPLRRKLARLLERHDVRVVVPVAATRRIVRLSPAGEVLSARRSPRRGRVEDVFARLVSLPALLAHPRFELELLLTHEEEHRRHEPGRGVPPPRLGRRRALARLRRAKPPAVGSGRRRGTPPRPAELLRHGRARRGRPLHPPPRPADDVLPAGDGCARGRRPPRPRRRPPARGGAVAR